MEMVGNVPMQVMSGGTGEGESKYASIETSSLGMRPPIRQDHSVHYQVIDHKATKVSHSHGSWTALGISHSPPLQRAAHPHGLLYAELGPPPPQHKAIKNRIVLEEPRTPYAIVLPQKGHATSTGG